MTEFTVVAGEVPAAVKNTRERDKSFLLRAWILSGLFFMALPGTLLGFSNLLAISTQHGRSNLPPVFASSLSRDLVHPSGATIN
jgi:hypothetical protein